MLTLLIPLVTSDTAVKFKHFGNLPVLLQTRVGSLPYPHMGCDLDVFLVLTQYRRRLIEAIV